MAANVPEMRLNGFTEPWEQRKLGDVIVDFYCGQTPYRQNELYWNGMVNWLASGDLNRGLVVETAEKITEYGKESTGLRVVPKGTVVIATMGQEAPLTRGNCGILGVDTTINQACMALFVDKGTIDNDFLFQWYKSVGDAYGLRYTQGTKQQNYNAETLGKLGIALPSIEEQRLIGAVLRCFDNLITLHQHEYDKLVTDKISFLQRLYPRDGANTAALRFDGFPVAYERRQAKSIFREYDMRDHAGLPVLSAHQKLGMVPRTQIGYEIFHDEAQERTYKHILPGQFVIHLRSFQGGFAHSAVEGIASPAYTVLEFCDEGRDYDLYWKHLFMSRRFIDSLRVVTYGIRDGRSISVPEFKELFFYTPCYEEQKAIGDFFEELDRLIGLEAIELEKLKHVKSTLLRKMFV